MSNTIDRFKIDRLLDEQLRSLWSSGKALVVMGPRQVGKTTLLKKLCDEHGSYLLLNADEADVRNQLENANLVRLKQILGRTRCCLSTKRSGSKTLG